MQYTTIVIKMEDQDAMYHSLGLTSTKVTPPLLKLLHTCGTEVLPSGGPPLHLVVHLQHFEDTLIQTD